MNSRYGLFVIGTCWIGLAGCATMNQNGGLLSNNRLFNNRTGPGTAALAQPAAPPQAPVFGVAPGTSFNNDAMAPPPPPPPPDFSAPAKLDLSDAAINESRSMASTAPAASASSSAKKKTASPTPSKMYNLESSSRKVASSAKSRSTIDKLAEKSTKKASQAVASKSASSSASSSSSGSGLSALARLSADAEDTRKEVAPKVAVTPPAPAAPVAAPPAPVAAVPDDLPAPAAPATPTLPAPAAPRAANSADPLIDTALLAAPVRKGDGEEKSAAKDDNESRPQSNALPGSSLFSPDKRELMIYPVSNPATKPEVDLTSIS